MASTSINIDIKGVDNASAVLQGVKGKIEGLNQKVVEAGQIGKQATSVASAGFQAMNGTLSGAISSARGMASAIAGMGVAMNTALPIAAAVAAAIAGISKAIQMEKEANLKALRDQEQALDAMAANADRANRELERRLALENKLRGIRDEISGISDDPVKAAQSRIQAISDEIATVKREIDNQRSSAAIHRRDAVEKTEQIDTGYWSKTFFGVFDDSKEMAESAQKARDKALKAAQQEMELRDRLVALEEQRILAVKKLAEARVAEEKKAAEARQAKAKEEADARYDAARKAGEAFLRLAEAEDKAIKGLRDLAARRDEEIRADAKASLARSVQQTTGGSRSASLEEVARATALQAAGILKLTATGYSTSQGDAMRQAEKDRKTEQYQQKMIQLVEEVARSSKVSSAELNLNVMDF